VGTIGGNAATASPSGDTLPALWALDAQVELTSGSGVRTLPIAEFVLGPGVTSLRPQELITAILVKKKPRSTHHFEKVGLRSSQACSIVNLAAVFACEDDKIVEIALAWGAVGPTVIRSAEIEQALVGRPLTVEALGEVEDLVRSTVKPIDDIRASAEYRRAVAAALLFRLTAYASSGDTSAPL
jgi:xanthine dehydrogenase FAD-binding subunit